MQVALHPDFRSARVSALVAIVAAIMLAIGLVAPRPASAGEYTIYACQADEAGYVSAAFENFATRGMKWRRACDPRGKGSEGLSRRTFLVPVALSKERSLGSSSTLRLGRRSHASAGRARHSAATAATPCNSSPSVPALRRSR